MSTDGEPWRTDKIAGSVSVVPYAVVSLPVGKAAFDGSAYSKGEGVARAHVK